ncbi:MAG: ion channel DMI1 [Gemmatimonadota bacterium]
MHQRLLNRLKFILERLMVRGARYQLLVVACVIGLVSVLAGGLVHWWGHGWELDFGESLWWAFLRLTDPGYLGDDRLGEVGLLAVVVSTLLTVAGYVLFLGALVAILTQWLIEAMEELESGLTPIALNDHILVLGWTNRTPTIVKELLLSEGRVRRFLRRRRTRTLNIAVLAEKVTAALRQDFRDRLGSLWNERQITLRTGTPLRLEHLRRVDFANAAAIVLPATDFAAGGTAANDTRIIKTLLSITNHPAAREADRVLPLVVAELFDARKIRVARRAYGGDVEILASDAIVSRLVAQNVRHPGLSRVFRELLTHGRGNEIYVRDCGALAGRRLQDLAAAFPEAVLLGAVRRDARSYRPFLNPPDGFTLEPGDGLVLLARSYAETAPDPAAVGAPVVRGLPPVSEPPVAAARRILVLGWSHKVPALLEEFDSYVGEVFEIDVVSTVSVEERETRLRRRAFEPARVRATQLDADYTAPSDLARLEPAGYDNIVMMGSDWLGSGEESDARTIMGYLLLREILPVTGGPELLVELLDPGNVGLFRKRPGEVLISPLILSHMMAQVALRRELRAVFDELFGARGAEIQFHAARPYTGGAPVEFADIARAAAAGGAIALGVVTRRPHDELHSLLRLNPSARTRLELSDHDQVVILTTKTGAG